MKEMNLDDECGVRVSARRVRRTIFAPLSAQLNLFELSDPEIANQAGYGKGAINGLFERTEIFIADRIELGFEYFVRSTFASNLDWAIRSESPGLLVREHAIKRYIERADATFEQVFSGLTWATLLCEAWAPPDFRPGSALVVPTPEGLFLASSSPRYLRSMQEITRNRAATCNRRVLIDPYGHLTTLHTFITFAEMSDEQAAIWNRLDKMREGIGRQLLAAPYHPALLGRSRSPLDTSDLSRLRDALLRLASTREWSRAVGNPPAEAMSLGPDQFLGALSREVICKATGDFSAEPDTELSNRILDVAHQRRQPLAQC